MKCYDCDREASAKIGRANGNVFAALVPRTISRWLKWEVWDKSERYYCRRCYVEMGGKE